MVKANTKGICCLDVLCTSHSKTHTRKEVIKSVIIKHIPLLWEINWSDTFVACSSTELETNKFK